VVGIAPRAVGIAAKVVVVAVIVVGWVEVGSCRIVISGSMGAAVFVVMQIGIEETDAARMDRTMVKR